MEQNNKQTCPITSPEDEEQAYPCNKQLYKNTPMCWYHWTMVAPILRRNYFDAERAAIEDIQKKVDEGMVHS